MLDVQYTSKRIVIAAQTFGFTVTKYDVQPSHVISNRYVFRASWKETVEKMSDSAGLSLIKSRVDSNVYEKIVMACRTYFTTIGEIEGLTGHALSNFVENGIRSIM